MNQSHRTKKLKNKNCKSSLDFSPLFLIPLESLPRYKIPAGIKIISPSHRFPYQALPTAISQKTAWQGWDFLDWRLEACPWYPCLKRTCAPLNLLNRNRRTWISASRIKMQKQQQHEYQVLLLPFCYLPQPTPAERAEHSKASAIVPLSKSSQSTA